MQTKPNINSRQGNAPSLFDFADATDPTERKRLLMEELRRTQSALSSRRRPTLAIFCTPPDRPPTSMTKAIPQGFGSPTSAVASLATKPRKVCPATAGARTGSSPSTTLPVSTANSASLSQAAFKLSQDKKKGHRLDR